MAPKLEVSPELAARIRKLSEEACLRVATLLGGALDKWVRGMTGTEGASITAERPAAYGEKTFVTSRREELRVGLRLRMLDPKRVMREARVRSEGIVISGTEAEVFHSLSAAARRLTDYQVNGWTAWEYWNEARQTWRPAQELRRG